MFTSQRNFFIFRLLNLYNYYFVAVDKIFNKGFNFNGFNEQFTDY